MKKLFFLFIIFLSIGRLWAQEVDSLHIQDEKAIEIKTEEETAPVSREEWRPSPKKATLLSTAFPGLGQIYVKSYWKAPIIYAAEGVIIYLMIQNHRQFVDFRDAYLIRIDPNSTETDKFFDDPYYQNAEQLRITRDEYRRNRDLAIIIGALVYGMQILDATVDAHLKGFKISDDLSLEINPFFYKHNTPNLASGLSLTFRFK